MATQLAGSKAIVRCPVCGTHRLSLRKERDPIDRLYQTPSRLVQRWLSEEMQLYHCYVCRLQFYDDGEMAPPKSAVPPVAAPLADVVAVQAAAAPEATRIGAGVTIKGCVSGAENIVLEGEVEGVVELPAHCLTVAPAGRLRGNVHACAVTIRSQAIVIGDIHSRSLSVQEGAYVKARIDE